MRDLRDEPQLGLLGCLTDQIAFGGGCKAALGRERQLITGDVFARLVDPTEKGVSRLDGLRGPEHKAQGPAWTA
jgi:hypothetical protein